MSARRAAAALAALCVGWSATLWAGPWADARVSDLFVYRQAAAPMLEGALPYRDVFFEYPPLAAAAIAAPGLASTGEEGYRAAFAALALVLAALVLLLTGGLAARTGGDPRRAMLAVAAAPLLCGAMIRTHFDVAPVALTLGALLLLISGRPRAGLAVLGLGVMTKGFPLVAAPPALAWLLARGERRAALEGAVALALVVAALAAGALAVSPSGASDAVRYHLERPVQVESTPASVLIALDRLGLGAAESVKSHRSDGLLHPADGAVAAAFGTALVALVALLSAMAAGGRPPGERSLVLASLAAVAAFAALGKVLSPQFLVWIVPLGALAFAWRLHALAAACAAAIALTLVEFPSRYLDLVAREPFPLAVVTLRNAFLLGVLVLCWRALAGPARRALPAATGRLLPSPR